MGSAFRWAMPTSFIDTRVFQGGVLYFWLARPAIVGGVELAVNRDRRVEEGINADRPTGGLECQWQVRDQGGSGVTLVLAGSLSFWPTCPSLPSCPLLPFGAPFL